MSAFIPWKRHCLLDYVGEITSEQFRDVYQSYYAKDKRSFHLSCQHSHDTGSLCLRGEIPTYSAPSKRMKVSPTLVLLLIDNLRIHGYGIARTATSPSTSVIPDHKSNHSCGIRVLSLSRTT